MSDYSLIEATFSDCDLLYEWANDVDVRENSFDNNRIAYQDHVKWFEDKLRSDKSSIYIFKREQKSIGMMRLEKIGQDRLLINYSIDKKYRGHGYGTKLLQLIRNRQGNMTLIGKVKKDNYGSIKAFEKAGYIMKEELEYLIFYSKDEPRKE